MHAEIRTALSFTKAIEDGTLDDHPLFLLGEKVEPTALNFIFRYLRECYPASEADSIPVVDRLARLLTKYPSLVQLARKGSDLAMEEWFDDTYNMRKFRGKAEEFLTLLFDKLDG